MSLWVSRESAYLARVECMRFFSAVRILEKAMRIRGSSRSSRSEPGAIQMEGRVPLCRSVARPSASSLSVLPKVPGTGVHITHHHFGLRSMSHLRQAAGCLDLIHDPVPVAHGFQGDGRARREAGEECPDGAGGVVHPGPLHGLALPVEHGKERIVLVFVTADRIMGLLQHAAPPVHWLSRIYHCSGRCSAFI